MSAINLKRKFAAATITAGLLLSSSIGFARDAEHTTEDIIRALKPIANTTRGLTLAQKSDEVGFVQTLRNRSARSLTSAERDNIASVAEKKPRIDLEINFDYNSDIIGPKAAAQVSALGRALASRELQGSTFLVAGYTDGRGSDTFNQNLSERRADAVKRYLAQKYSVQAANLVTVGYGKTRLKIPSDPASAQNRRVQVVNMASN